MSSGLLARLQSRFRSITNRKRLEDEMDEELRFHLEARAADLAGTGLDEKEAMRKARLEFGPFATHKDDIRRSLGLRWWDELWGDVRYALRILRKSPGFTAIAVCSLALAIGANTTIFSVANELLYARLGVSHPEQLRLLTVVGDEHSVVNDSWGSDSTLANGDHQYGVLTYPIYQQLRQQNQTLQDLFAFKQISDVGVTIDGVATATKLQLVSGNYYQQLHVTPQIGRAILPSDDGVPGTGAVVTISDGFWARAFGRSPGAIGKTITVNLNLVTIVGVNPPGFTGAESVQVSPDIFMPLSMSHLIRAMDMKGQSYMSDPSLWWVEVMGRAKPGISMQQAQASLDVALNAAVRGTITVKKNQTVPHLKLEDGSRGLNAYAEQFAQPMHVLLTMVGLVLLLACANMANLMLARASTRRREMGVRLALGAGRWRVHRQVLTESLFLAIVGGGLGMLLGYLGRTAIPGLVFSSWDNGTIVLPFDWWVFAFTAGITISAGMLFGLAPAWAATRTEIGTVLKQGSKTSTRHRTAWGSKVIVTFQVALSTLLVVAAGLFIQTILHIDAIDPGFNPNHLLIFHISPPSQRYLPPKDIALHARLEAILRQVPGVESVALSNPPFLADDRWRSGIYIEGTTPPSSGKGSLSFLATVGPDFFRAMQIPMLAGRAFTEQDAKSAEGVTVVNQSLARKFFPNQNPLGRRFALAYLTNAKEMRWLQIVGVCGDTRYSSLQGEPPPLHFDLYRQETSVSGATYIVRTSMKPEAIVPSLRAAVQRVDRDLPLMDVRTMQQQIDASLQQQRMFAALTSGFGLLALALACVGIYGIMAYTVAQRTNEIGIRLALGAERRQVRGMVLREAGWLAIIGVACGLAVALALGKLVQSMLYGLQPADPTSLAAAGILLLAVALASGWLPAARASSVEPMEALRHE